MARWTPGPVFVFECVTAARRWQTYAGRVAFLALLLVSLAVVWVSKVANNPAASNLSRLAQVGEAFFYAVVGTQLGLVLLAAPAYTAGAVCLDKARGTLAHMLVTDLSSSEIVLGKLGSRLLPVLGLILLTLPIVALAVLLGGIEPESLLGGFLVTLGVGVFGCALALALSVWGNKPHEVLLGTFVVWAVVLLALPAWKLLGSGPAPTWLENSNPFWLAFAPYLRPGSGSWEDCLVFLGGCLSLSALLTLLAAATLRRAAVREPSRRAERIWPLRWPAYLSPPFAYLSPSIDFNPVLWREWHRRRPSRWVRVVWVVYVLLSLAASVTVLVIRGRAGGGSMAAFVNAFQYSIGLLLVSVTSVTSLFEERVRGSLDVLLTTPLPTSSIVWGKWWGAFRSALLVMLLPLGLIVCLALLRWEEGETALRSQGLSVLLIGLILVCGVPVMGVGLVVATLLGRGRRRGSFLGPALAMLLLLVGATLFLGLVNNLAVWGLVLLLTALMLAYGAAVTSLGLALATWVKRFGVAIGLSVAIYVLVTGGAVLLPLAVGAGGRDSYAFMSPWYGAGELTFEIDERGRFVEPVGWKIAWGVFHALAALALAVATRRTFDRCMGRVTGPIRKVRYVYTPRR
jgi:ABC-type transport system involved in multi-copper enzyme maturation permease subunit